MDIRERTRRRYEPVAIFFGGLMYIFTYISTVVFGDGRKQYGSRRSFVRRLGSLLPLRQAPRIYLGPKVRQSIGGMGDFSVDEDSAYGCSYNLFADVISRSSTPVNAQEQEKTLQALEQEVHALRGIVEQLLRRHLASECQNSEALLSSCSPAVTPPPPPPLPPPLPLSLTPIPAGEDPEEVLTLGNLASVKLHPVERTPGGRPVRRPMTPYQPSNVLVAVLKKRFAALHSESPNSMSSDGSFNQTSPDVAKSCQPSVVLRLFD